MIKNLFKMLTTTMTLFILFSSLSLEAGRMKRVKTVNLPAENGAPANTEGILPAPVLPTEPLTVMEEDGELVIHRSEHRRRTHGQWQGRDPSLEMGTREHYRANVSFSSFQGATFSRPFCFRKCTLSSTNFIGTALCPNSQFIESTILRATFDHATLSELYAANTDFSHSHFRYLKNFHGAECIDCTFFKCQFSRANLSEALFDHSTFKQATFMHAILTNSSFDETSFIHADLSHAQLSHSSFVDADLSHANLSHALLKKTDLLGAKLINANLSEAIFWETDLRGADLTNALIERTSFLGALINTDTKGDIATLIAFGARFVED